MFVMASNMSLKPRKFGARWLGANKCEVWDVDADVLAQMRECASSMSVDQDGKEHPSPDAIRLVEDPAGIDWDVARESIRPRLAELESDIGNLQQRLDSLKAERDSLTGKMTDIAELSSGRKPGGGRAFKAAK